MFPEVPTYFEANKKINDDNLLISDVMEIFKISRNNYGTRKIKVELTKRGYSVSRRRIGRIMKKNGLVSNYTVAQFKPHIDHCNESKTANLVSREFSNQSYLKVVVSDLTYVRVGSNWHYICVLVDLFNREIIGYSAGRNKDALLVSRAFSMVKINLNDIRIFHTDYTEEKTMPKFL